MIGRENVAQGSTDDALLLVASDEPTLKALGFYHREGRTEGGDIVTLD